MTVIKVCLQHLFYFFLQTGFQCTLCISHVHVNNHQVAADIALYCVGPLLCGYIMGNVLQVYINEQRKSYMNKVGIKTLLSSHQLEPGYMNAHDHSIREEASKREKQLPYNLEI